MVSGDQNTDSLLYDQFSNLCYKTRSSVGWYSTRAMVIIMSRYTDIPLGLYVVREIPWFCRALNPAANQHPSMKRSQFR
jgi:hypothetical protein